jgi:transposase
MGGMADAKTWEERVADWRGSGQSAEEYCKGKGFSSGTLYRWSSRVRPPGSAAERAQEGSVGLVRVVRAPARSQVVSAPTSASAGAVLLEVEGVRVVVPPGADAATVRVVLEALRAAGGAGR